MKPTRVIGYLITAVLFLTTLAAGVAEAANDTPLPASKYVFLISIDGLSSEAFAAMKHGALQSLADEGIMSEKSVAVRSNDVAAGEASLLTGCNPEDHGGKSDQGSQVDAESLFDVLKKHHKSLLVVDGSGGVLKGFSHGSREYTKVTGKNDLLVMKQALDVFTKEHPYLTYIYLGGPRQALSRRDRDDYYVALDYSQQAVGLLMHQLRVWGIDDFSMVIVTSTRSSSSSNLVPIIIKGPGLRSDYRVDGMKVTDLAATICAFNNLPLPYGTGGVVPWSAVGTKRLEATTFYQEKQIKELYRDRLDNSKLYYRLQDNRDTLVQEVARANKERQSIFDFVGQRDQTVSQLKKRLVFTRSAFLGMIGMFLLGYYLEYRVLRKRYYLF